MRVPHARQGDKQPTLRGRKRGTDFVRQWGRILRESQGSSTHIGEVSPRPTFSDCKGRAEPNAPHRVGV